MSNATWAGRSATPPTPEDDNQRAGWVPIVGVVAALGLVGAGGYLLGSSDETTAAGATSAPTATVLEAADETAEEPKAAAIAPVEDEGTADDSTATGETSTESASTETASTDTAAIGDPDVLPNQVILEDGEVRGALLRDGVLYLGGAVPSQDVADQIIERAEAVVGEGNVVSEYVIEPGTEMGQGAPLAIDDVVLFAYGANTYDPQFEPLLDLGLLLLSQNPTVIVTIITHTDTSGSAEYNERLSYQRGQSVAQYWVDRGIPVEQIVIEARGEREPRIDDQDGGDGAQLNRRAEFFIAGLLP